jgi:hypothetical protein
MMWKQVTKIYTVVLTYNSVLGVLSREFKLVMPQVEKI